MSDDADVHAVFVYGTLKRGQCRARCWPRPPMAVDQAVAVGRLHDLGPYPALVDGDDRILGELWWFRPEDLNETLRVLDRIECFGVDDVDLYTRRVITCQTVDGQVHRAFTYFLADPSAAAGYPRVVPDAEGLCYWPTHCRAL